MERNSFIKVLSYDTNLCDSICIVNKSSIAYFEIENYYEDEYVIGILYLKNGKEIMVNEEGIEQLQNDLLNIIIEKRKKTITSPSSKTIDFILNSKEMWDKTIGISDRFKILNMITKEYKEEISERIRLMSYNDFLNTPYWKAISVYKKIKARRCEICGSKFELHTHHKTYENHGYEILHLEDLQVICGRCHFALHKGDKNNG